MLKNARLTVSGFSKKINQFKIEDPRKKAIFKSLLYTFGTDFVIHNTNCYHYANNALCDFVYSTATHNALLWVIEDPNSKFFIRQAATSAYHFNRLLSSLILSSVDYSISNVFDFFSFITRLSPTFFVDKSNLRAFKRIMLVLRRNGGVYEDMFELLSSFYRTYSVEYENVLNSRTFYTQDHHIDRKTITFKEAKQIIERELNIIFDDNFTPFNTNLIKSDENLTDLYKNERKCRELFNINFYKDVTTLDCRLKDSPNVAVTISVMPPHLQRMRTLDLFPLKVVSSLMGIIPFMGGNSQLFKATIKRLEWNIPKEVKSRRLILEKFGVDEFKNQNFLKVPKSNNSQKKLSDQKETIEKDSEMKVINTKSVISLFKKSRQVAKISCPFISPISSFVKKIFSTSSKSLPLYVPAPIPQLCSKHVMVSDLENHDELFQSNSIILHKLVNFTTRLHKKSQYVVPNMSLSNISTASNYSKSNYNNNIDGSDDENDDDDDESSDDEDSLFYDSSNLVSLRRYGTIVKAEKEDITNLGLLFAGLLIDDKNMVMKGAKHFNVDKQSALDVISDSSSYGPLSSFFSFFRRSNKNIKNNRFSKIAKCLMPKNANFVLTAGETVLSLSGHVSDTMDMGAKVTKATTDYIGTLLTDYSLSFVD